jgi:ATP-dependent Lon protease
MSDEERTTAGEEELLSVAEAQEIARGRLPDVLPVLPLKNTVIFPHLLAPLLVNTERSRKLIDAVMASPDRHLLSVAVSGPIEGSPSESDLHRIGTVLRVAKMLRFLDGSYRLLVQGIARARIEEFVPGADFFRGRISLLADRGDASSVEAQALARDVRDGFVSLVAEHPKLSDELQVLAMNVEEPGRLADLVASNLELEVVAKQGFLEELDVVARLRRARAEVQRAAEALKVESEIRDKVQSEMGRTQREYMLRQQLDQIRKELGEAEDEEEEADALRRRIEAAGLPEDAADQAKRELERLEQTPTAAAEHGVIRNYLDWMADLPWSKRSEDRVDVTVARQVLDEDHYGLEKVKDRIVEYIAVLSLKRDLRGPILCFMGPPGTGKTSLGRSIARALGRQFERISLGGVRDEAEIRGHRRTYVGALPGRILQGLRRAGTCNPVFMLDEIDKLGADFRGDPSSALLEVLDPEQNSTFSDHYLEVAFDLSKVLFIATANMADPIHPALRDRMEIIELPGYTEEDKIEIAKRFLVPRQLAANGLSAESFAFDDSALRGIVRRYTREAGVRNLEREIGAVCRKIARRVAESGICEELARITDEQLPELLGPVRFEPELAERAGRAGVAVGLAYTPAGGDILFVESTHMPGKGGLKLTGSLGDVMRESTEAARTWLRSHASDYAIAPELFEKRDLHVHVPQGAVPKDGPSAGVAMVTSLASLLTGRVPAADVAMTGEITLRGKVLPVGGIKEKVLAAKRAGIKRVVLPELNKRDVDEIAAPLVEGLEFDYVARIDDALDRILEPARA